MDLHGDTTLTLMRIAQLQALAATFGDNVPPSAAANGVSFAQQLALASGAISPSADPETTAAPPTAPSATLSAGAPSPLLEQYPTGDTRFGPTNPPL